VAGFEPAFYVPLVAVALSSQPHTVHFNQSMLEQSFTVGNVNVVIILGNEPNAYGIEPVQPALRKTFPHSN